MASTFCSSANHRLPFATTVFIALPWLNPFSPGAMPSVVPLLVSWTCIAALLSIIGLRHLGQGGPRTTQAIATAWLVAALLSALIGLAQYFGQSQVLISPWINNTSIGEAFANLRQRNHFATLCSMGLIALLWQVGRERPVTGAVPFKRWLQWGLCALLLACANAASGSRTGFMQWWLIAGMAAVWGALHGRREAGTDKHHVRMTTMAVAALALYLLGLWLLPHVLEITTGFVSDGLMGRFKDEAGCSSRRILWSNVAHLIAQKPWFGWGWGELGFAHFMTLYPGERFCDILDNAHNLPLHLAVELGVPFALVVCGAVLGLVWCAKPWREHSETRQLAWGVLTVIALHSLVEYPLWYGPFQMAVGLCVWLLCTTPRSSGSAVTATSLAAKSWRIRPLAPVFTASIATILIVFLGYTAWSYWRANQLYLQQSERAAAYRDDTLDKLRGIWLFQNPVRFAELTTTIVTADNAAYIQALAQQLLHFSPEPRVVEKLVESALAQGREDVAAYYLQRYRAAFPKEHAIWKEQLAVGNKTP